MSRAELDRFMADLQRKPDLLRGFQELENDLEASVRFANAGGYQFTLTEAEVLHSQGEVSDDELEQAAGGWTDPPPPTGG